MIGDRAEVGLRVGRPAYVLKRLVDRQIVAGVIRALQRLSTCRPMACELVDVSAQGSP